METLVHANPIGYAYAALILWLIILGPFLALWIALSVRRDIHRIADALERENRSELAAAQSHWVAAITKSAPPEQGIANSMFGR